MAADWGRYVGVPFKDHGRDEFGCDCWGLLRLIYRNEFGVELSDLGPLYRSTVDENGMLSLYVAQLPMWSKVADPFPGDAVLMRLHGIPIHVGIVVDENRMLHIERGTDAVIERFDSALWKERVEGFYRYEGLTDGAA